ncbi:MAG: aminotransferase class V-fold PLP-dependent enzyme, partial [Sinobacteraceae bacterium]|nr:aminotransferase class V-fold PLP-dependent enzyme [Nevskiaceae bacterium]
MRVNRPPSTHPLTIVGHADSGDDDDTALAPPIIQTSAFRARSAADFEEMAGPRHNRNYTRDGNPTFTRVEKIIAELEGAETALLTASGMGAMSASVLAHVSQGEHVVAQRSHYMGTTQLLTDVLPRFGVEVTHVDQTSISALEAAVRETTKLIIVETPANPLLNLTDLAAVAAIARPRGILTICDSTIGTPINQQPLQLGIDLVMHSATKFLGGHHDLLAGVVAGRRKLIDPIWHLTVALGPVADPFSAWLLLRGLRTLPLRVERHNHSALQIARFLETHAAVSAVHYPGLEEHPQHELARR